MLAAVPSTRVPSPRNEQIAPARGGPNSDHAFVSGGLERHLDAGECLFRSGEPKTHVYRIVSGLVAAHAPDGAGGKRAVGFSFPGEIVGLGALDRHVTGVEAVSSSIVQCLPRTELDRLIAANELLAERHDEATAKEFSLLKDKLATEGRANTLQRVAALLTVLAANGAREGRAADTVADDVTCGGVASQLGIDLDALEHALVSLRGMGLIEPTSGGAVRLLDATALDRLSAGEPAMAVSR